MQIQQQDDGKTGSFFITKNGEQPALMTYRWTAGTVITIDHTEVSEKLEGKGIGRQLVQAAITFAREKNIQLIPECSFAKAIINKTPAWQDVLK